MKYEFTEAELKEKIKVPKTVEITLRDTVDKCLEKCGLYHQVFSRIKTHHSLARKYKRKCYNEDKKIQDLVGIRIDVYFEDDLKIVRNLLEKLFGKAEWSLTDYSSEEFKPTKMNGVFKLPEELVNMISDETWQYYIDDTFEIQLKTVFFEGWHEIEHDMKYKGDDLWADKADRSRYFNTILATLELCDKSIVTLFENLGHDLYHEKNWAGMMKAHFRIKMKSTDLYPELLEYFNNDTRVDNFPKRIFKTKREDLILALVSRPGKSEINVNTIVAVLNDFIFHDENVSRILDDNDVYGRRQGNNIDDEVGRYDLRLPEFMYTFKADVILKTKEDNKEKNFLYAVNTIYSWLFNKFQGVNLEIPEAPRNTDIEKLGFRIKVLCESENYKFKIMASHIDEKYAGRIWETKASLLPAKNGQLRLKVSNGFTYYRSNETEKSEVQHMFSCPRFYRQIATQIGVRDVWECGGIHCILNERQADLLRELILSEDRAFPVVMVVSKNENDGRLDESWLGSFAIRYIQEKAGYYAHFARVSADMAKYIRKTVYDSGASVAHRTEIVNGEQGIFVIYDRKNGELQAEWFSEEYIRNCRFATFDAITHLQPFKNQDNARAFGNELLQLLRRINTDYEYI